MNPGISTSQGFDEGLLAAVTQANALVLGAGDLDELIPQALARLGQDLQVDYAYLCEYQLDQQSGAACLFHRHTWQNKEAPPADPKAHALLHQRLFNDIYKKLAAGRIINVRTSELPSVQRANMEDRRVRSFIIIPVTVCGAWWGCVGFEDMRLERTWSALDETLLRTFAGSLSTALTCRVMNQQLASRDRLLRGVALATQELLSSTDIVRILPHALATLGEAAQVDRVYIFENAIGPGGVDRRLFARHVWSRGGASVESAIRDLKNLDYDQLFPRWFEILSSGRPISGRVLDFLKLNHLQNEPTLRSILLVPIVSENRFWGIIGFDDHNVNREWASGDEAILKAVAGGIGGAMARQQAALALRASEEHFRSLIENGSDVIALLDMNGAFVYASPSVERTLGYTPEELLGQKALGLLHPDDLRSMTPLRDVLITQPEAIRTAEFRLRRKDGSWRAFEGMLKITRPGQPRGYVLNARDISERQASEEALRQSNDMLRHSQKMEAVGRLAGGVAHDFNNLLTAIMGYGDILRERLSPDHDMRYEVDEICKAADRAHGLTRQLLAFSRKQVLEPKVVNLNSVVVEVRKLLSRLIGEHIEFKTVLNPDIGSVRVDPGQMEQVLINLAVNARDAMKDGGCITLCTGQEDLEQPRRSGNHTVKPGRYITLSISDTGHGMTEEVQSHLFEPFFTTKEVGQGTGLGLSMVYGIIEQSGGNILFESSPGLGTTFTLYFPRLPRNEPAPLVIPPRLPVGGHETILLVEDEDMVRDLTCRILRERGYQVLVAPSGAEALRVMEEKQGRADLLLTDIVMPQMSGRALAQRILAGWPHTRVLYMSGYAQEGSASLDDPILEKNFIQKPFPPADLARKVRDVLDAP